MKRDCRICEREITVKNERIGRFKPMSINTSDEGVFFEYGKGIKQRTGVWFCNDCWKELLK